MTLEEEEDDEAEEEDDEAEVTDVSCTSTKTGKAE